MGHSFMFRRGGRYYFRVRIPEQLWEYFGGSKEIRQSLRTGTYELARLQVKVLAARAAVSFDSMVRYKASMNNEQLREIANKFLHGTLADSEESRNAGLGLRAEGDRQKALVGYSAVFDTYSKALSLLDVAATKERGLETVRPLVQQVCELEGITLEYGSPEYVGLTRELAKRVLEVCKVEDSRLSGDHLNAYDRGLMYAAPVNSQVVADAVAAEGGLLSAVVIAYTQEHITLKKWTAKTEQENTAILSVLLELLGDKPVTSISHRELQGFRSTLVKLPPNPRKGKGREGKTLQEVIALGLPPMSQTTVNKYLIRIASFFKWAHRHKYISSNEFEGLTLAKHKRGKQSEERSIYSTSDLVQLLQSLEFDKARPEQFWIPLISLYSGLRLNEVCQLHLTDIKDHEGVPCFSVNEEGDKEVKTASSVRLVPVHPVLIDLGLLDYVEKLRRRGSVRLWGRLQKQRDGYGQAFGKWYQRFNRSKITKERGKVFHSFRHTFTNALKQAGVSESVSAQLIGHGQATITFGRYGKDYIASVLLEAVRLVDYGESVAAALVELKGRLVCNNTRRGKGAYDV